MTALVIDSSAALSWCFEDEARAVFRDVYDSIPAVVSAFAVTQIALETEGLALEVNAPLTR
jgi:hypothetical protein